VTAPARMTDLARLEPWLDKRALAAYLGCSYRFVEERKRDGMPHAIIAGRLKYRVSEVEPWLEARGHFKLGGDRAA
jgi:hypothetical protein